MVIGGSFTGNFGSPRDAIAAIERHSGRSRRVLPKFDPVPQGRTSRDYNLSLDINAQPVDAQPNNDAVDRCVTPILRRVVFPQFTVPLKSKTLVVGPRITWLPD